VLSLGLLHSDPSQRSGANVNVTRTGAAELGYAIVTRCALPRKTSAAPCRNRSAPLARTARR
jgi:hypothetical protein